MEAKKTKISLSETKQFSKLFIDYINGEKSLRHFYAYTPEVNSIKIAIEDRGKINTNRNALVKVLHAQYQKLETVKLNNKVIDSLSDKNTFTVCTGHQLCLFTGPLYFIYKIISTINLSEGLKKKYPSYNFVPVYWMASEDHDFEEVSSVNVFGKKVVWNNPNAKGPVGRLETFSIDNAIAELKQILGESENANELIQLLHDAYLKHNNLSYATRYLVDHLFGEYGLVIIDAADESLKREFTLFIKDDILNNTNHVLVNNTIKELNLLGYEAQVNPREINCFYIRYGIRERIELTDMSPFEGGKGDGYKVLNTDIKFSKEDLINEIELHPEHFSPNVVLRPLYQQYILPNLAYVGGPGELAYWLEYKAMFDHHQIQFPVLIPRNFAILSDAKTNQQIDKLGLRQNDFFDDVELVIKKFISKNSNGVHFALEEEKLNAVFDDIETKAITVDKTLKGAVEAEKQKVLNSLKMIESKIVKAEKQKHEISINQIRKIKDKFFPETILQERYDNMSAYYLKMGKNFIPSLKEVFKPFELDMNIIEIS